MDSANFYIQLVCAGVMLFAPLALVYYVYYRDNRFITGRIVQFLALTEIVPAVVILGLQQVLEKGAASTILAGVAGYVLGGVGGSGGTTGNTQMPKSPGPSSTPSPIPGPDAPPLPETPTFGERPSMRRMNMPT